MVLINVITEILNEENKVLKQAPHKDANTDSPWLHPRSSGTYGPAIVQPPIVVPTTHGIPVASQYALPVANRFDDLLKRHESQEPRDSIFPTKLEQSSKIMTGNTNEQDKGLRRTKLPTVNQHRRQVFHLRNKPNLQEPIINEDGTCFIPILVNGVTNVNLPSVTVPKYSDSKKNLIHNLRETINVLNKKCTHHKNHKIILIGDSNIKGYACNLKSLLSNNYEFYSIVKPGSTTSELKESAIEEVSHLSHDDVIIICSGTNDYEQYKFSLTLHNIMNYVKSNSHTNIILMNVPY